MSTSDILVSSLFSWEDESGQTQTLDVDVVMAAVDRRQAKMTDHVVEDGSVITDDVVVLPKSINFELTVTQTPITGSSMVSRPLTINHSAQRLTSATYPLDVAPSRFVPGGFLMLTRGVRTLVTAGVNALLGAGGVGASSFQGFAVEQSAKSSAVQVLQATTDTDRVSEAHDKLIDILERKLPVTVSFKGKIYSSYMLTEVTLTQAAGCGRFKVEARSLRTVQGTNVQLPSPADFRAKKSQKKGNKPGTVPDPDPAKKAASLLKREKTRITSGEATGVENALGVLIGARAP